MILFSNLFEKKIGRNYLFRDKFPIANVRYLLNLRFFIYYYILYIYWYTGRKLKNRNPTFLEMDTRKRRKVELMWPWEKRGKGVLKLHSGTCGWAKGLGKHTLINTECSENIYTGTYHPYLDLSMNSLYYHSRSVCQSISSLKICSCL